MSNTSHPHPAELLHDLHDNEIEDVPPPLQPTDSLSPQLPSPEKKLKKSRSLFSLRPKRNDERKRKHSLGTLVGRKDTECEGSRRQSMLDGDQAEEVPISFAYEGRVDPDFELPSGDDNKNDLYRWAILYENQRGFTLFSTPHYSSRTLLPNDPAPFTVPIPPDRRKKKKDAASDMKPSDLMRTPFSLRDYQLPDAQWRWVSKSWMVDMRGDGEVCSSGFEYNWVFREHGWRPYPGKLNTGAWVRRRRWLRLMMKPADPKALEDRQSSRPGVTPSTSKSSLPPNRSQRTLPVSNSSSSLPSRSSLPRHNESSEIDSNAPSSVESALENTWRGDGDDWARCRLVMRHCTTDGKKLEKWRHWLGLPLPSSTSGVSFPSYGQEDYLVAKPWKGKGKELPEDVDEQYHLGETVERPRQTPEVVVTEPVPDPKWVAQVLKNHAQDILYLFVFPDSRAQFLDLLEEAGMESGVIQCFPPTAPAEFWSRRCSAFLPDEENDDPAQQTTKKLSIGGVEKKVSTE